MQDPNLYATHQKAFLKVIDKSTTSQRDAVEIARQHLLQSGLASRSEDGRLVWHPIREDGTKLKQSYTRYEQQLIEEFNAALVSGLALPGALAVSSPQNYVDHRLFAIKTWRDVYRYDAKGELAGWIRYGKKEVTTFTEDGLIVLKLDGAGRPIQVRTVNYRWTPSNAQGRPGNLDYLEGDETINYSYGNGKRVETSRGRAQKGS